MVGGGRTNADRFRPADQIPGIREECGVVFAREFLPGVFVEIRNSDEFGLIPHLVICLEVTGPQMAHTDDSDFYFFHRFSG